MRSKDFRFARTTLRRPQSSLVFFTPVFSDYQIYDDVPQEAAYLESDLDKEEIPKGGCVWANAKRIVLGVQSAMTGDFEFYVSCRRNGYHTTELVNKSKSSLIFQHFCSHFLFSGGCRRVADEGQNRHHWFECQVSSAVGFCSEKPLTLDTCASKGALEGYVRVGLNSFMYNIILWFMFCQLSW